MKFMAHRRLGILIAFFVSAYILIIYSNGEGGYENFTASSSEDELLEVSWVKLINETFKLNQPELCDPLQEGIELLILVLSSPGNAVQRNAIRETWGSESLNASSPTRLGFLLGYTPNATLQELVEAEAKAQGDLIQGTFLDTYANLTLKSIALLEWSVRYCPNARFVLKTDDDMYINVPVLTRVLADLPAHKAGLYGALFHRARPNRDPKAKWHVPTSMYDKTIFPDYLSGTGYAISQAALLPLLRASRQVKFLNMEDIYITGICAEAAQIPRHNVKGFWYHHRKPSACEYSNAISGHLVPPEEMYIIWKDLHKDDLKCPVRLFSSH